MHPSEASLSRRSIVAQHNDLFGSVDLRAGSSSRMTSVAPRPDNTLIPISAALAFASSTLLQRLIGAHAAMMTLLLSSLAIAPAPPGTSTTRQMITTKLGLECFFFFVLLFLPLFFSFHFNFCSFLFSTYLCY
jgi:hypothetical protein